MEKPTKVKQEKMDCIITYLNFQKKYMVQFFYLLEVYLELYSGDHEKIGSALFSIANFYDKFERDDCGSQFYKSKAVITKSIKYLDDDIKKLIANNLRNRSIGVSRGYSIWLNEIASLYRKELIFL